MAVRNYVRDSKGRFSSRGGGTIAKARRASFKARHASNIAKGKMSAAYWADREKW